MKQRRLRRDCTSSCSEPKVNITHHQTQDFIPCRTVVRNFLPWDFQRYIRYTTSRQTCLWFSAHLCGFSLERRKIIFPLPLWVLGWDPWIPKLGMQTHDYFLKLFLCLSLSLSLPIFIVPVEFYNSMPQIVLEFSGHFLLNQDINSWGGLRDFSPLGYMICIISSSWIWRQPSCIGLCLV